MQLIFPQGIYTYAFLKCILLGPYCLFNMRLEAKQTPLELVDLFLLCIQVYT